MPKIAWRSIAACGLVVALLVAGLLTWLVVADNSAVTAWDEAITDSVRGWADPKGWPVTISAVVGWLTEPLISALLAAIMALVLYRHGHRPAARLLIASAVTGVIVSETTKQLVGRARPPAAALHRDDLGLSFPSGHAMAGIYLYCVAGFILFQLGRAGDRGALRNCGIALMILGPFIGVTRLVLGVHWPTDILGGWAYGSVVALTWSLVLWSPVAASWSVPEVAAEPELAVSD